MEFYKLKRRRKKLITTTVNPMIITLIPLRTTMTEMLVTDEQPGTGGALERLS